MGRGWKGVPSKNNGKGPILVLNSQWALYLGWECGKGLHLKCRVASQKQ